MTSPPLTRAWHDDGTECAHGWEPPARPGERIMAPAPVTCRGGLPLTRIRYSNDHPGWEDPP
jgi:hypothetical protein